MENEMDLNALTTIQLTAKYNELVPKAPVKKFKTKHLALARVQRVLKEQVEQAKTKIETRGRKGFHTARVILGGKTVLQSKSKRRLIFDVIAANPGILIDDLNKKIGYQTRQYVLKLVEFGHAEVFDKEGKKIILKRAS